MHTFKVACLSIVQTYYINRKILIREEKKEKLDLWAQASILLAMSLLVSKTSAWDSRRTRIVSSWKMWIQEIVRPVTRFHR